MASGRNQALARRSTDTHLMPPPPKRIKRPTKVLDEEVYTEALSDIIARDFFPGLVETDTQQEYLDALDSKDNQWIASASRRLNEVMTPGRRNPRRGTSLARPRSVMSTPRDYGGDTPMSVISTSSTQTEEPLKPEVKRNLRLDTFQSTYTSEDNESFNKLLDKQNEKKRKKYAWMWNDNKIAAPRQILHREKETKLLEAKLAQEEEDGGRQLASIVPKDERKAMPDTWKSRPNNEFMFQPDSIEDEMETVQQSAEAKSKAPPKAVVHHNTRLHSLTKSSAATPGSPSLSAIGDAIAGKPRLSRSEITASGSETPRVNGYAFVDDEEPVMEPSHIFTGSNPLLGNGDLNPGPFNIKEGSKRESLHHRMVERIGKGKRLSTQQGMVGKADKTPIPTFPNSPRVTSSLTPAAQRLWSQVRSPGQNVAVGAFDAKETRAKQKDSSLRFRWTPTPKSTGPKGD